WRGTFDPQGDRQAPRPFARGGPPDREARAGRPGPEGRKKKADSSELIGHTTAARRFMCGIIGYAGRREAEPLLVAGLRRLEYRGYASGGVATVAGRRLHVRKRAGRIASLVEHLRDRPAPGCAGISHTRWATHGPANDGNAHPHLSNGGRVAVVHNGV